MNKIINYFGGEKRFYIILITLIIMWLILIIFFYLKADEVTKDPCSICAKRLNENIICSLPSGAKIIQRTYYPNFEIKTEGGIGGGGGGGIQDAPLLPGQQGPVR